MMRSFRVSWSLLITIILLCFTFSNLSEANHEKKLPSAVVVGTVYCDTCFLDDFSKTSHFISGALVAVECRGTSTTPSFHKEVKTNEHGEFEVNLPFSVTKQVKKIKKCSVKLISSSEPNCAVASTATSSSLHLKSRNQETHIFSAGFFTFKPPKQPTLCNQKPSGVSKELNPKNHPKPSTTSKLSNGKVSQQLLFSPIPEIPLLPTPPVSGLPLPPIPLLPPSILPPIPLLPPPSIIPPIPLLPPPSSILPPIPLKPPQPPPSILPPIPLPPLPPVPGLNPPPPSPSTFPIPLPPGFPGIPPASSSP